jgi:hypothetical protein
LPSYSKLPAKCSNTAVQTYSSQIASPLCLSCLCV